MNRKVVAVLGVLVLLAGGYFVYTKYVKKDAEPANEETEAKVEKPVETKASGNTQVPPPGQRPAEFSMDDDPEGSLRLEGQVIDESGGGVPGALVTLTSNPPRSIKAEDDGTFVFDKLVGRTYALSARSGSSVGGPVAYKLTGEGDPAIIPMRIGGSVSVKVLAESTGKPLAGATVELRTLERRVETTDSDGVAKIDGVGSGWFSVVANAPGYGTARQSLSMPSSPGAKLNVELSLGLGVSVSGTVTGDGGAPVVGATVTPHSVGGFLDGIDRRYDGTKTDDKGAYKLEGVAVGKIQLHAYHKEYAVGRTDPLEVTGDLKGITIALDRGGLIAGRVVTKGGEPVPWASVRVNAAGDGSAMWGGSNRGTTTDEKGEFDIKGLPLGKMSLLASSEDASSEVVDVDLSKTDKATGLEIVLGITGTISGKVVDSSGNELPEVQVVLAPDWTSGVDSKRMMLYQSDSRTTAGDGGFTFTGLPDGVYLIKASRDPGSSMVWQMEGKRATTGETDVEIVLPKNGGVKGTVVSSQGSIKAFSVTVGWPPGYPFADGTGKFEMKSIPPGNYDLKIRGPDFADTTIPVEIKPDEIKDLGTIKVVRGRALIGRVVDSKGSPVAGATIIMAAQLMGSGESLSFSTDSNMDEMMGVRRGTSDDDGRFRMRGIPSKAMVIAAEGSENERSRPFNLPQGQADANVTLSLIPTGSVTGTIRRGDDIAPKASVIATPSEARLQMMIAQADDKGVYNLTKLAEGSYEISANFANGFTQQTMTRKLTVKAGEVHKLDLVFKPGDITLLVTVTPEPGAKVDATQIFLFSGTLDPKNARDLYDAALGQESDSGAQSISIAGAVVELKDLNPGTMTLCGLPITGDMRDQQFMQRLQEHATSLKVVCKVIEIAESPAQQPIELVVPQMEPLPTPEGQPAEP